VLDKREQAVGTPGKKRSLIENGRVSTDDCHLWDVKSEIRWRGLYNTVQEQDKHT